MGKKEEYFLVKYNEEMTKITLRKERAHLEHISST